MNDPRVAQPQASAAFGLMLALVALMLAAGLWGTGLLGSANRQIVATTTPKQLAADQVRFNMADLYGFQTAYGLRRGWARPALVRRGGTSSPFDLTTAFAVVLSWARGGWARQQR